MVMALAVVATALPAFAGDGGGDAERASAASARGGQIVFRRYFDAEQTKGAIFVMNADGSHVRQITHPPKGWKDNVPAWSPNGKWVTFERFKADESTSRVLPIAPRRTTARTGRWS